MKKICTLTLSFFFLASLAYSQLDTSGGRYCQPVFPTVTITSNVTYGSSLTVSGSTQTLVMDIYEPTGDVALTRGMIVFAHGGSFIGGTRADQDVSTLCTRFAKMGYVTCSIDYRLGFFPFDSVNATKAVIRATQDMKAAVRFFRQDAATTNLYRVDTNYIFAGGSSAGAFMSLHLAYLDKPSEVPSWVNIASLGGLDGSSGNPGHSSKVNAVINLCGALGDSTWLEPGDIPLVSMHGTADQTVPYGHAMIYVSGFAIMIVDGSASIKQRADNVGVQNPFYTWYGAPHVPYAGTSASAIAYMDTTVEFIREFLCPIVSSPSIFTTVQDVSSKHGVAVYPNPSNGRFTVRLAEASNGNRLILTDVTGRIVEQTTLNGIEYSYQGARLKSGIYFLKIIRSNSEEVVQKILITE